MDERTKRFWKMVGNIDNERHARWARAFWDSFSATFNPDKLPASRTIAGRWPRHPYDMAVERLEGFLSSFTFVVDGRKRTWSGEGVLENDKPFVRRLVASAVKASVPEDCKVDVEGLFGDGDTRSRLLTDAGGVEAVFTLAKHFSATFEDSRGVRYWNARDWEAFEDSVRGGVNTDQNESQHSFARLLLDRLRGIVCPASALTIPDFFDLLLLQRFHPTRYSRWKTGEQTAFPTGLFRDPFEMALNIVTFVCARKGLEGLEDSESRFSEARRYVEEWVKKGIDKLEDDVKTIACEVKETSRGIAVSAIELTEKRLLLVPAVRKAAEGQAAGASPKGGGSNPWDDVLFLLTLACCVGSRREDALWYCEKRFGETAPRTGEFYKNSGKEADETPAIQGSGSAIMPVLLKTDSDGRTSGVFALYGRTLKGHITRKSRSFFFNEGNNSTRFSAESASGTANVTIDFLRTESEATALLHAKNKPLGASMVREERGGQREDIVFQNSDGQWNASWSCLGTLVFRRNDADSCVDDFGLRLIETERPTHLVVFSQSAGQFYDIPLDDLKSRRLVIAGAHFGNRLYTRPFLDFSERNHPDVQLENEGLLDIPENERLIRICNDKAEECGCHVLYVDDSNVARLNTDKPQPGNNHEPDSEFGGQCSILWTAERGWVLNQISDRSFTVVSRGRNCYFPGADGVELEIGDLIRFVPGILVAGSLPGMSARDAVETLDREKIERVLAAAEEKTIQEACKTIVKSVDNPFNEDRVDLCSVRWGWR